MDPKSKEQFEEILRKEPAALTPGDVDFLKARASYLSEADVERYKSVLAEPEKPKAKKD
jgi:hypothetical protein